MNIILQRRRTTRKRSFHGPVKAGLTEREARELLKVQFSDSCDSQEDVEVSSSEQTSDIEKQLTNSVHNERGKGSIERSLEVEGKSGEARASTKELENQMPAATVIECNKVPFNRKNEEAKDKKLMGNTTIKREKRKRKSSVMSPKATDSNDDEPGSEKGKFRK